MLIGEKMKKWNLLALVFVLSALFCLTGNGTAHSGGTMIDLGTLGGQGARPGVSMTVVKSLGYHLQPLARFMLFYTPGRR